MSSRAAVLLGPRAPVSIQELPLAPPSAGEALVRMEACGLCHSDVMISGLEALPLSPLVLGHEGIGRVEAVGEGVTSVAVGDRVGVTFLAGTCGACELCRGGAERYCPKQLQHGFTRHGAMASLALVQAERLAKVPPSLSATHAAPLCCAGWTAYGALRAARLERGQSVAVFGLGGLGHLAVQYAVHLGLRVAAADVVDRKLEQARALGAELAAPAEDAGKLISREWGGAHAAIVFTPSAQAIHQAFRALRRTGTLWLVGMSATTRYDLSLNDTILKGISVRGSYLGTREDLEEVFRLAVAGVGVPHVEEHPLEAVPELVHRLRAGEILGRAVVSFSSAPGDGASPRPR